MFRHLLNFWLQFIVFGFAAGAVADLTGGGAGDGGAGSGEGEGGASSATENTGDGANAGTAEGAGLDDEAGAGEGAGSGEGQADPNALVDDGSGRKIPQKYSELFKNDKALREMYFSQAVLKKTFPGGVKDAVALAKTVEEFGGVEAVEQLQSDLQTHQAESELFEKADPKWVEAGFEENPEASLKLFAHSLEYIGEHHPEHYNHLMAKVIVSDLAGLNLHGIHGLLAGMKDNPEATKLAKQISEFYNARLEMSKKVPEKQIDPQQKKLDARQAELDKKDQQIRNKAINSEATPHLNTSINSAVDRAAKANGFDIAKIRSEQPKRYAKFVQDVKNSIFAAVRGDDKWLDRYSKALSSGDTAKCVRMLNARHSQAVDGNDTKAGIAAQAFEEWFGTGKPKVTPNGGDKAGRDKGNSGGGSGSGSGSMLRVNAMPPKNEINWQHPKTRIIDQVAMRRDGKLVSWAK